MNSKSPKTNRRTYSRMIGYCFGSDLDGNEQIYDGAYYDEITGKKQYSFSLYRDNEFKGQFITDYRGFREIVDKIDFPKNR